MQGLVVFKTVDVIESIFASIVWQVEANTPVKAKNKEVEIIAYTDTSSNRQLTEEAVELEHARLQPRVDKVVLIIFPEIPNIADVDK